MPYIADLTWFYELLFWEKIALVSLIALSLFFSLREISLWYLGIGKLRKEIRSLQKHIEALEDELKWNRNFYFQEDPAEDLKLDEEKQESFPLDQ